MNAKQTHLELSPISTGQLWTGRILTGLVGVFFLFDAIMKLIKPAAVVQATQQLGYQIPTMTGSASLSSSAQ